MTALSPAGAAWPGPFLLQDDASGYWAYLCPACGCREDPPVNPNGASNPYLVIQGWAADHAISLHGLTESDVTVLGIFPFIPVAPDATVRAPVSAFLSWEAWFSPDSWVVEQSAAPFTTWAALASGVGGRPNSPSTTGLDLLNSTNMTTTITSLVTSTSYQFRLRAVVNGVVGNPGPASNTVTAT